jgi:CBS domain containing-hemolysin-like protein
MSVAPKPGSGEPAESHVVEPGAAAADANPAGIQAKGDRAPFAVRLREWLRQLIGARAPEDRLRDDLEELLEEHAETPIDREERMLLGNILKVGELRVDDVEVPRADIIAVEEGIAFDQLVKAFTDAEHSRLPVYRDTLDQVVGMVHIKDLMPYWKGDKPFRIADVLRKPLFVPPSMPVLDLLLQMRARRTHLALVVDEYGGVDGLVTIEDLVEQIVGEIHDEHDEAETPTLVERPGGLIEADARCPVVDLEAKIGLTLISPEQHEEIDTLGGLVFSLVGRVPQRGELVRHESGIAFEVLDADPRRIKRLRVRNAPQPDKPA